MYVSAIELGEKVLGHDHPDFARGLADRAALLRRQVRVVVFPRTLLVDHGLVKDRSVLPTNMFKLVYCDTVIPVLCIFRAVVRYVCSATGILA